MPIIYIITQVAIYIVVFAISIAVLRWALKIDESLRLQREILANLRRINANTKPDDIPTRPTAHTYSSAGRVPPTS